MAEQIRAERGVANLSKSEVARRAGIAWSTYLKVDSGARVADVSQIARICAALNIDLVRFMEDVQRRVADSNGSNPVP